MLNVRASGEGFVSGMGLLWGGSGRTRKGLEVSGSALGGGHGLQPCKYNCCDIKNPCAQVIRARITAGKKRA